MKYVIIKNPDTGIESAIMFDESMSHKLFADFAPISAGFIAIDHDEIHIHGRSVGLNIDSRPEDARIVRRAMIITNEIFHEEPVFTKSIIDEEVPDA